MYILYNEEIDLWSYPIADSFLRAFRCIEMQARMNAEKKSGVDGILKRLKNKVEAVYEREIDFSNHTLRRTGGRMLWKAKVPLEVIKEILGYEDTKQTVRYLGLNLDDQDEAMRRLAQFQNSLIFPEKEILGASQMKWWAQRDLDS
jgi:hypothetical protein